MMSTSSLYSFPTTFDFFSRLSTWEAFFSRFPRNRRICEAHNVSNNEIIKKKKEEEKKVQKISFNTFDS